MVEMRKALMNVDLINALKSTGPSGVQPYITGVGLYTHAEGPSNVTISTQRGFLQSKPRFLSVSRNFESKNSGSKLPKKVHRVWESLRDILKVEEETIGRLELGLEHLKQRYGGLPVPECSMFLAQLEREDRLMQQEEHQRGTVITERATGLQSATRPTSGVAAADVSEVNNVNTPGAEEKRKRKIPSSTQIYRPYPRRQKRSCETCTRMEST